MGCLPTANQIELIRQTVEQVAFAAQKFDWITRLPVSDRDVEVTAQHEVRTVAKPGETIKNVMHRADISEFAGRSMNAEHNKTTWRPRRALNLAANDPAVIFRNRDRNQRCGSCKQSRAPTSRSGRLPRERIVAAVPESLAGRVFGRTALLRQD